MVIHFLMVNLPHFCGGLKAQHVLITVAPHKVVTRNHRYGGANYGCVVRSCDDQPNEPVEDV